MGDPSFSMARRQQWLPAVAAIITVAACLCAVIIASNTGSAVHRASMMQIYAAQPAPLQMLDDEAGDEEEAELPLKESEEYDDVAPGLHANEEEDGTITDPESLLDVLNDCSQASNCWALRGKPERGKNTERMPLFRLAPTN